MQYIHMQEVIEAPYNRDSISQLPSVNPPMFTGVGWLCEVSKWLPVWYTLLLHASYLPVTCRIKGDSLKHLVTVAD